MVWRVFMLVLGCNGLISLLLNLSVPPTLCSFIHQSPHLSYPLSSFFFCFFLFFYPLSSSLYFSILMFPLSLCWWFPWSLMSTWVLFLLLPVYHYTVQLLHIWLLLFFFYCSLSLVMYIFAMKMQQPGSLSLFHLE